MNSLPLLLANLLLPLAALLAIGGWAVVRRKYWNEYQSRKAQRHAKS